MDILSFILAIVAIITGFLIGKHITEKVKWSDKKKLIDEQWKAKLTEAQNDFKNQILEIKKDNQIELKQIVHDWEMKYTNELAEIKDLFKNTEKYLRLDAVKRSRRTLLGKLWEQVSPYIPKFPFKPSDMKFLGAPIDFVIFDGMGEKEIKQVVFLEVKSGDSKLNAQEKKLKQVIEDGKVVWKLFNIDKSGKLKIEEEAEREDVVERVTPNDIYEHIDNKISSVKTEVGKSAVLDSGDDEETFACKHCGEDFTLSEKEKKEIEKWGTFDVECPNCHKKLEFQLDE